MFEFENLNISNITDLILKSKEDVGTAIKSEDEEETKNKEVDIFGIFSIIPLFFYRKTEIIVQDIYKYLITKIEKYLAKDQMEIADSIISKSKIGLLINERALNLPQEAIPLALNFVIKEMAECREIEDYDNKYDLDYIVIISKFAKENKKEKLKKNIKKNKIEDEHEENILHYKYETEHFLEKAVLKFDYRIPYEKMDMEYLENKNEPQYYSIMFILYEDFIKVVDFLLKKN